MFRKRNVPSRVRVLLGAGRQTCMYWRVFATKVKLANARVFTTVFIYTSYMSVRCYGTNVTKYIDIQKH